MSLIGKLRSFCFHDDCKATRYEAATQLERMQAEIDRLNDHLLETQMLAHKWMEAHDKRAAGKPYKCPSPADLPDALAEVERRGTLIRKVLDYYEGNKPFDFHRLHNDFDRSNQAFDAWQEIVGELKSALDSQGHSSGKPA